MVDWGQAGSMVAVHTEGFRRAARAGALGGEQVPANVRYVQGPWSRGLRKWAGQGWVSGRRDRPGALLYRASWE